MSRALLSALALALLVAGCGTVGGQSGETATLWITRAGGGEVMFEGSVPAGLTVMQALNRVADVETRHGGRFVQSIDGVEGSLEQGRDWFYFVNGYEADRGAAEYRLHAGDVAWWDFRSWSGGRQEPVVVGAFPEPFLHGYRGRTRPAVVRYERRADADVARDIAELVGAASVEPAAVPAPPDANVVVLAGEGSRFVARLRDGGGAGSPVEFVLGADAERLARDPALARFRYEGLP